jgi:uncharacterized protein YegL
MKKTAKKKAPPKKRVSKKVKKQTYVAIVVDRSGSMSSVQKAAVSGINEQIKALRDNAEKGGDTRVTYIQFDSEIDTLYANRPASELKEILDSEFQPRGLTAMRDAVWTAINTLKASVKEVTDDTAFLVVVISDGIENASRECTQEMLAKETKFLEATDKWTFTYLLSNQDIKLAEQMLGVRKGNIASYASTNVGTSRGFASMASNTANYLSSREVGMTYSANFYDNNRPEPTLDNSVPSVSVTAIPTSIILQPQANVTTPRQDATVVIKTGVQSDPGLPKMPGQ